MSKDKLSQEQICVEAVNKAPEPEKKSVFEKACALVKNKTKVAALALSLGISGPALASTPSPQETQKVEQTQTTQETFDLSKVPEAFKENINIINLKIEEGRKTGEFTTLDGFKISDGTPNSLASSLNNAPDVPFKGLTSFDRIPNSKQLKEKNMDLQTYWEELIKATYDVNGDKSWMTKGLDRQPLSKEELDDYKKSLEERQTNMINKLGVWLAEGDKGLRNANQTISLTMGMLGYCVDNGVFPKTEAWRRCVTTTTTILHYATLNEQPSEKDLNYYDIITDLSNQAGEFLILTQKGIHLTRLVVSGKTYTFPSDEDIANHPILGQIPLLKGIGTKSLKLIGEKLKNEGTILSLSDLKDKNTELDKQNAELDKQNAELDKQNAELDKQNAELDKQNKEKEIYVVYFEKITKKYQTIVLLTQEYNNHKNDSTGEKLRQELLENFAEINKYKIEIEQKLIENESITLKKDYQELLANIDEVLKIQQAQKLG